MSAHLTASDLLAHYKAVRARLHPQPVRVVAKPRAVAVIRYSAPIGPILPASEVRRRAMAAEAAMRKAALAAEQSAFAISTRSVAKGIVLDVCVKHGVTLAEICSEQRAKRLVEARHEAAYRLKKETTWSLPKIGQFLGGRDHSSIFHAVRKHAAKNGLPL